MQQTSWKSILQSGKPTEIAEFVRRNTIDVAWSCGLKLLTDEVHGKWLTELLCGQADMTLLAHRGSYKTTCLDVAIPTMMVTNPNANIIFLRKTDDDVMEVVRQSKKILTSPVMQQIALAIHGKAIVLVKDSAWELDTNLKSSARGAGQLLGIGSNGSITGKHADIVITDDIVNARDRVSRAERERVKLLYMELQNIRNRGGRIINTGTPWHKEDAISLMPNVRRYDCYQTGLIGKEALEELRQSMSPSLFAANYELQHIAAENALFSVSPRFTSDATLLRDGIAHVDASYGGEDGTAFTCGKRVGDVVYMYGRLWHGHVDKHMADIAADCARLKCAPLSMEYNADKGYLLKNFQQIGVTAQGYHESMNKYVKISTYLRKWWPKMIWLEGTDMEYLAQIMDYTGDAEHDDAPDSAACVARNLDRPKRSSLI